MNEPASGHAGHDEGLSYLQVYLILMVMTVLTVAASRIDLGVHIGIIVGLVIASTKATLVGLYFMHLKFEVKNIYIVVAVPLALLVILLFMLMPDIANPLH